MANARTDAPPEASNHDLPLWLELTISEIGGYMGGAGRQSMAGHFCALFSRRGELTDATVSILARGKTGAWQTYEQSVSLESAAAIAGLVRSLGMPARKPDVEPAFDTSSTWTHLSLRVKENDQALLLDLPMQCSGFEGSDAETLRRLFRAVFAVAGFADFDQSVFGGPGQPTPPVNSQPRAHGPRWCSHCGHDVGTECYSGDVDVSCGNDACRRTLMRGDATCQAAPCGHLAPIGAKHCWYCGAATVAS